MRTRLIALALPAVIIAPVAAQSTGSPVYTAPYRAFTTSEIGFSLSDPGAGTDVEMSYRTRFAPQLDLGFRGGFHSWPGPYGPTYALLGADLRDRVLQHSEAFPLDGSFTLGLGFESGRGTTVGFLPIGFSMGRRVPLEGSSVSLVPYVQPVLMPLFGDASGTEFSLGFGVDARLARRFDLRLSAAIGDRSGVALTTAFLH